MDVLKIDNDYYFEIITNVEKYKDVASNINGIKIKDIKKKQHFLLIIDFKALQEKSYKKMLKHLMRVKKLAKLHHIEIGDDKKCIGYLVNYDKENHLHNNLIYGINAILYKKRRDRYNYVYDKTCEELDSCFYGKNVCDFKDNQCGEKRGTTSHIGCCRRSRFFFFGKWIPCKYLGKDYKCEAKCMACKLFTCDYLEKKGIKFRIKDMLLLNTFFNPIQKVVLKCMLYTPKERIMRTLVLL